MELIYNLDAAFTRWVVKGGLIAEPFVLIDVGVQGGEQTRWRQLGDHLVVHGFDPIEEVVRELAERNSGNRNRHYHAMAVGAADEERTFYFNPANPTASSMYPQGESRFDAIEGQSARTVQVCRLDTLLAQGAIPRADFLKVDVEGFESEVLLGAPRLLAAGMLGVETESNFAVSPTYPKGHFATLQEILLEQNFLVFDVGFNRVPRASFQRALARNGRRPVRNVGRIGRPATLDVIFCRDLIDEVDHPENYRAAPQAFSVDQLIKMAIVYELHALNDVAVDTIERFADRLGGRLDTEHAIRLLADRQCRPGPIGAPLRRVKRALQRRLGVALRVAKGGLGS